VSGEAHFGALRALARRRTGPCLRLEELEPREVPAIQTVNSVADNNSRDDLLTLREAIMVVNGTLPLVQLFPFEQAQINGDLGEADEIVFDFTSGMGALNPPAYPIIKVQSALPRIEEPVTVDGGGTVWLAGLEAGGANIPGLSITTDTLITGLKISSFSGPGVLIKGAADDAYGDNRISACTIESNGESGVEVNGSTKNVIRSNVIRYNEQDGVVISGENAVDNAVDSCLITDNILDGVQISSKASKNAVGRWTGANGEEATGNTIVNNGRNGVAITATGPSDFPTENQVNGNYIGIILFLGIEKVAGNGEDGVYITGDKNTLGSETAGFGNVISGNTKNGVEIVGGKENKLVANIIGLNRTGEYDCDDYGNLTGNGLDGVLIKNSLTRLATQNRVGGFNQPANVISSNGGRGVVITGDASGKAERNWIIENIIGANKGNSTPYTNDGDAIHLDTTTLTTFTGNKGYYASGKRAARGLKADGTAGNGNNTIRQAAGAGGMVSAPANEFTESTDLTLDNNVIDAGIALFGCTTATITGNDIGVDGNGASLSNIGDGIYIDAATSHVTIGGDGGSNVISNNGGVGVHSLGADVWVLANTISSNVTGILVEASDTHLGVTTADSFVLNGGTAITELPTTVGSALVTGGTLLINAPLTVTGNFTQTGGTTTISGTLDDRGNATLSGGTITDLGRLQVTGALVISGGSLTTTDTADWPYVVAGDLAQSGGDLHMMFSHLQVGHDYQMTGGTGLLRDSTGAVGGQMQLSGGELTLDNNGYSFAVADGVFIEAGGTLALGGGTLTADVSNAGLLRLDQLDGSVADFYTIAGNYTQSSSGLMRMYASPLYHFRLDVTGLAALDGAFTLVGVNGYNPGSGFVFVPVRYGARSGVFATVNLPPLSPLLGITEHWELHYDDPQYPNSISLWVVVDGGMIP
jgi:filamentous hemagglutinin